LNERIAVPLPTIELTDIGKEGKGATPEEITDQVVDAILKGAQNAVAQAQIDVEKLTGAVMEEAGKAMEGAAGEAGKALENMTEGTGDVGKDAGDAVRGLIQGIGR
jgi:hypothetical protein